MGTNNFGPFGFVGKEGINLICGTIICTNHKSMVIHVKYEVLSHDSQPDESDVRTAKKSCQQKIKVAAEDRPVSTLTFRRQSWL